MSSVDLSRLTAIVHASASPRSVDRLIASFRCFYPRVKLLVADDSRQPRPIPGADVVKLPADVGASAARNALLARVRTPYFLLLEAGVELSRRTRLELLLAPVAESRFEIVGGSYLACRKKWFVLTSRTPSPGLARIEVLDDSIALHCGSRAACDGIELCDLTHNFFAARTDKVRMMGGWDPQLMVDERIEFFVRARRFGLRVGMCPQVVAQHWGDASASADARRGRDFQGLAIAKMGVARMIDADGVVHQASTRTQAA